MTRLSVASVVVSKFRVVKLAPVWVWLRFLAEKRSFLLGIRHLKVLTSFTKGVKLITRFVLVRSRLLLQWFDEENGRILIIGGVFTSLSINREQTRSLK